MTRRLSVVFALTCCLALGLLFGGILGPAAPLPVAAAESRMEARELEDLTEFAGKLERLFQQAAEKVKPAVVAVQTATIVRQRSRRPFDDDFMERFFGDRFPGFEDYFRAPQEREYRRPGLGSGIILDDEGHILTNNHVVAGADELKVKLADGRTFDAKVIGTDDKTDLAVIKIEGEPENLPTVVLGESDELTAGQWVLAIGNPLGFMHTVSAGIVSATGRSGLGVAEYESLIQTDAAINFGNSGGPLVNLRGEVVGINTAIVGSGGFIGIGFAIPIDMAKDILDDLVEGREVRRGYLGLQIEDLTPEMAEAFGFKGTQGVLVQEVVADSPAEKAGMKAGDIITEYDGHEMNKATELRRRAAGTEPGTTVRMNVWREGKELTVRIKTGELEAAATTTDWLGLQVEPLTRDKAEKMGRPDLEGLLVVNVKENSTALRSGITPGDVILSVNRQSVTSVSQYQKLMAEGREQGRALVRFLDAETGQARFILLQTR